MVVSYDIILAEDNTSDAELAIRVLRKTGVTERMLHVEDGEELLEYVFANGRYKNRNTAEKPRLIIMDLKMPKVNGMDVLKEIKSNDDMRNIPVVLLTSSREQNDVHLGYALGVNSYVVKPLDYDEYVAVVSNIARYWLLTNLSCL